MTWTVRSFFQVCGCAPLFAVIALLSTVVHATPINHGSFGPVAPGVTFIDVVESSGTDPVPLYGPPTPFSIGLDFNPTNFSASSTSGGADLTDGQLNFTVASGLPITQLTLSESGFFSLSGTGTSDTAVSAGAIILATVTEVNGAAVAPINLTALNDTVAFDLINNSGLAQPWSVNFNIPVAAQVPGATRIDVAINNALSAGSEPSSSSQIAKSDFKITVEVVPEPTSLAFASFALVGLGFATRRRG